MAQISIHKIDVSNRLRPADPAWVAAIADSMSARGQDTPIVLRDMDGDRYELAAGLHRLEAARELGWTTIEARVADLSADEARLVEIDENLMRRELSALDRAIFLAERKDVWDRVFPQARPGGDRKSKDRAEKSKGQNVLLIRSFSKDAAAKLGLNRKTIDRSIKRISALAPEVLEALRLSPIAQNASELDALGKESRENQIKIASAIARGAKNLANAKKAVGLGAPTPEDPDDFHYQKLVAAWGRASETARDRFCTFLDLVETGAASDDDDEEA